MCSALAKAGHGVTAATPSEASSSSKKATPSEASSSSKKAAPSKAVASVMDASQDDTQVPEDTLLDLIAEKFRMEGGTFDIPSSPDSDENINAKPATARVIKL